MEAYHIVEGPGLPWPQLRRALPQLGHCLADLARQRAHLALQVLLEGAQPCFGAVEPPERLVDGRQARFSDAGGLRFDLAEGLFVGLPNRLPLVLQAALELMDAGGRLVEQPPLDVVPLAQAAMKFDDSGRVSLVVLRPAVEDACALARHLAKARLEAVQRLLRLSKLAQGEIDLLDLNLQIGRSRRLFHCA